MAETILVVTAIIIVIAIGAIWALKPPNDG